MSTQSGMLRIVNKHFPKVTEVKDAENSIKIEVTSEDEKKSKRRNKNECAMAVACKRAFKADGVILARSVAYLIKGNLAVRFQVPETVSREIAVFDRGGGFASGLYHLAKPAPSMTLEFKKKDSKEKSNPGGRKQNKNKMKFFHRTTGIRTVLGSVDD